MQMYLMNQELSMTGRGELFQVQGCPAYLSAALEPPKRKINYFHTNDESMFPSASSAPRKDSDKDTPKEKLTATQANKIAVDLG